MYISHNHNIRGNVKRKEIQNCFYIRADFGQSRVFIFIFFFAAQAMQGQGSRSPDLRSHSDFFFQLRRFLLLRR